MIERKLKLLKRNKTFLLVSLITTITAAVFSLNIFTSRREEFKSQYIKKLEMQLQHFEISQKNLFKSLMYVSEFIASDTVITKNINLLDNYFDQDGKIIKDKKIVVKLKRNLQERLNYYLEKFNEDSIFQNIHLHIGESKATVAFLGNFTDSKTQQKKNLSGIDYDVYTQAIPLQGVFQKHNRIIFKAMSPILKDGAKQKSIGLVGAFSPIDILIESFHDNETIDINYAVILTKGKKVLKTSNENDVKLFVDKIDMTLKNSHTIFTNNNTTYAYAIKNIYEFNSDLYSDSKPIGIHIVWKNITLEIREFDQKIYKNLLQLLVILLLALCLIYITVKISEHYLQKIIAEQTESLSKEIKTRKKREEELELKSKESHLNAKFASIGEMAAGMAHEINNPLTIINGNLDRALRAISKDNIEKAIITINKGKKGVERITRIISLLKGYARDGRSDDFANITLDTIIKDSIDLTRDSIIRRDIKFHTPKDVNNTTTIFCQNIQIVQVIVNLLNNARDAVEDSKEPWVKMSYTENENKIILQISDSGKGIPKKIADQMFTPFYTTKEIGKGTGLGLGLSKEIIDKHSGRLYIDNEAKNTTFIIELKKQKTDMDREMITDDNISEYKQAS